MRHLSSPPPPVNSALTRGFRLHGGLNCEAALIWSLASGLRPTLLRFFPTHFPLTADVFRIMTLSRRSSVHQSHTDLRHCPRIFRERKYPGCIHFLQTAALEREVKAWFGLQEVQRRSRCSRFGVQKEMKLPLLTFCSEGFVQWRKSSVIIRNHTLST